MGKIIQPKNVEFILIAGLGLLLAGLAIFKSASGEGLIYLAEQLEVVSYDQFLRLFSSAWNEQSQSFALAEIPKNYLYGLLWAVGKVSFLSFKDFQIMLLASPIMIGFTGAYYLNRYLLESIKGFEYKTVPVIASLAGAFVFVVNPWFVNTPRNIMLRWQFAALPILIWLFLRFLDKPRYGRGVVLAAAFALMAGYRYSVIILPAFLAVFILHLVFKKEISRTKRAVGAGLAGLLAAVLCLGKFLPAVIYNAAGGRLGVGSFDWFGTNLQSLAGLLTTNTQQYVGSPFNIVYESATIYAFALVTLFALVYLWLWRFQKKKFVYWLPAVLFAVYSVFVVKFGGLNVFDYMQDLPLGEYWGKIFRRGKWNIMPVILAVSGGVSLSVAAIGYFWGRSRYALEWAFLVVLISGFAAWPVFTGDMNGYWSASLVPGDYARVNQLTSQGKDGYSHAAWIPGFGGRKAVWSRSGTPYEIGAPIGDMPARSSALPVRKTRGYFFDYYDILPERTGLNTYNDSSWGEIYGSLNTGYLIMQSDIGWGQKEKARGLTNQYVKARADKLKRDENLELVYESEHLNVLKNKKALPPVYATQAALAVNGSLPLLSDWLTSGPYADTQLVYLSDLKGGSSIDYEHLLVNDSWLPLILELAGDKLRLDMDESVLADAERNTGWRKLDYSRSGGLSGFKGLDKRMWNTPVLRKAVYSSVPGVLSIPFRSGIDGSYRLAARIMESPVGGRLSLHLDGQTLELNTKKQGAGGFVWRDLGRIRLSGEAHWLVWENKGGLNAVDEMLLVPEGRYWQALYAAESMAAQKNVVFGGGLDHFLVKQAGVAEMDIWTNRSKPRVAEAGEYRVYWQGKGMFDMKVGGRTYALSSASSAPVVHLPVGNLDLELWPRTAIAQPESLWFTGPGGNDRQAEATVKVDYERIDPATWKASFQADEPILLAFAENYDPWWEASIYRNGKLEDRVRAERLNSVINGFPLKQTGELDITIRYLPQNWLVIGYFFSAAAFILCLFIPLIRFMRGMLKNEK